LIFLPICVLPPSISRTFLAIIDTCQNGGQHQSAARFEFCVVMIFWN
jgi:hypothetical protein